MQQDGMAAISNMLSGLPGGYARPVDCWASRILGVIDRDLFDWATKDRKYLRHILVCRVSSWSPCMGYTGDWQTDEVQCERWMLQNSLPRDRPLSSWLTCNNNTNTVSYSHRSYWLCIRKWGGGSKCSNHHISKVVCAPKKRRCRWSICYYSTIYTARWVNA